MTNQYSYAESFSGSKVEAPKKKIPELNISSAAKVYMLSRMQEDGAVRGYRNGNDNGQKYMTGEDFVTYFQSRGKAPDRPENVAKSTVSTAEIYRSRPSENQPVKENTDRYSKAHSKATYGGPNVSESIKIYRPAAKKAQTEPDAKAFADNDDDVKIYIPNSKPSANMEISDAKTVRFVPQKPNRGETAVFKKVSPAKLSKIKKMADEWLPEDKIVNAKKEKKSARPFSRMILAVAGTAISLMLIVSGSVMMSGANREVKDLENELHELKASENDLGLELEMKNDVNVLRNRATEDLGMIRKEYVEANYLDVSGSDGIEVHEKEEEKDLGIAAILSAFGLAD